MPTASPATIPTRMLMGGDDHHDHGWCVQSQLLLVVLAPLALLSKAEISELKVANI